MRVSSKGAQIQDTIQMLHPSHIFPIARGKVPFTTVTKIIKYLGMNLRIMQKKRRIMQNPDEENHKH